MAYQGRGWSRDLDAENMISELEVELDMVPMIPMSVPIPYRRRDWSRDQDGWWSPLWGLRSVWLKFGYRTGENPFDFSDADNSELQLNDVLPSVRKMRFEFQRGGNWMKKVFEVIDQRNIELSQLKILEATDPGMNDVDPCRTLESLARAIARGRLPSLKRLALTEWKIGDGHFELARAMASRDGRQSALKSLDLSLTSLTEKHCVAYETALLLSKSLTEIRLARNRIGNVGAQSLGRAIGSGRLKNLEFLDLGWTHMNDDAMVTLADAFQESVASVLPNLRFLNLTNNSFTEVGLLSLAHALISGRLDSLKELDLTSSRSEKGANTLLSALQDNDCLTVDIKYEWFMFPDLDRRREHLQKRNLAKVDILAGLAESPVVPARFGKVYLCGNPEVGKTTLRRTLQRSIWESMWTWERRPRVEKCTRGIQVSQFLSKSSQPDTNPITLRVWDMAGQEDYHLVHNAFFPALTFVEGTATTFVLVCTTTNLERSVQELDYWLRFIASSCDKPIQDNLIQNLRNVLVVLNNFGGRRMARRYVDDWKEVLKLRREKFYGYLDIQADLFLVDVRKRRLVKGLKKHLSQCSRNLLKDQKVPAICQLIQENLVDWSNAKKQFPVLHWKGFVEKIYQVSDSWPLENTIEAAAKYLNEAGILIYIDKKFPAEWQIPYQRLVVLDPNWFCNEIVGHIFLTEDMLIQKERLFRSEVDRTTGSISISDFKRFFQSMHGEWSNADFDDLITILLWLGLCYKGRDQNVFIPALISEHGTPGSHWSPQKLRGQGGNQWVMGFSVEHEKNEIALAPMSLWHRFQVDIAQTPRFNGRRDNDLIADKYFMTFNVDFMCVLIVCQNSLFTLSKEDLYLPPRSDKKQTGSSTRAQQEPDTAARRAEVNVRCGSPTFDEINIYVMPLKKKDDMDGIQRKQLQVDLASDLVEILLGLWNAVCPGVKYVHRVTWPWPVSQPGPETNPKQNLKVTEVQKWVQEHGLGRKMQWEVGSDNWIPGDLLLSNKDKGYVVASVEDNLNVLREGMREAVELRIFPPDVLPEEVSREIKSTSHSVGDEAASQPLSPTGKLVLGLVSDVKRLEVKVDKMDKKVEEGFSMVMTKQKELLHKLLDTEEIFFQDKERTCPKYIFLGNKATGAWATLKDAFSVTVRLHFACEAEFDNYRPHKVEKQQGLDLSELKDWVKTITPWLKVSLTVLFLSAKVAANFVLPGVGLVLPGFVDWQQGGSLSEGISWATGYSIEELDKLMIEGMGLDANPAHWDARDLYGKSREAMTKLIGKLTPDNFLEKFGVRRVFLRSSDDSSHGIIWICSECFEKFRQYDSSSVREI